MSLILHCASSYPDPVSPDTVASSLLLELTAEAFTHKVFSFKRGGWRGEITTLGYDDAAGEGHRAMVYGAAPKGLQLARKMADIADWIIADARARDIRPGLVHAHKVSMDGLVGARVAAHFGVPLALTVQANTDIKIIRARRDLKPRFHEIWHGAAVVFPFAPVANDGIAALLGPRQGPTPMLPCPTPSDTVFAPRPRPEGAPPRILTAFHLAHYGNKNIETLLKAVTLAAREVPDIRLDIIGGGDTAAFLHVARMAQNLAPGRAILHGARRGPQMQELMRNATAFAMPSRRESYGMVFAEALLAGTPCLYPAGRAIDGLLPEGEMTLGVAPDDSEAMARALVQLCQQEQAFKARIASAQKAGRLEFLRRDHIAASYTHHLHAALSG